MLHSRLSALLYLHLVLYHLPDTGSLSLSGEAIIAAARADSKCACAWVAFCAAQLGGYVEDSDTDDVRYVRVPLQLPIHSLHPAVLANMRSAIIILAALATAVSAASLQARQNFPPW